MKSQSRSPRILVLASIVIAFVLAPLALARQTQDKEEPPKIIRKSGGVLQGTATRRVEPNYPPLAKAARVSGSVVVEVTLDEEGNVISARVISGHPLLKDAAVSAAKGWKFNPTLLQGTPVKVIGTITFNFNLDHSREIEAVKKQLVDDPNSADLHSQLGGLLRSDGKYEEAIVEYGRAIELGGETAEVLFDLGEAYSGAGRLGAAVDSYKRALSVNGPSGFGTSIKARLGEMYMRQSRYEEALEVFKQVVAEVPGLAVIHLDLGLIYLKLADKQSAQYEYRILKDLSEELADQLLRAIEKSQ